MYIDIIAKYLKNLSLQPVSSKVSLHVVDSLDEMSPLDETSCSIYILVYNPHPSFINNYINNIAVFKQGWIILCNCFPCMLWIYS